MTIYVILEGVACELDISNPANAKMVECVLRTDRHHMRTLGEGCCIMVYVPVRELQFDITQRKSRQTYILRLWD